MKINCSVFDLIPFVLPSVGEKCSIACIFSGLGEMQTISLRGRGQGPCLCLLQGFILRHPHLLFGPCQKHILGISQDARGLLLWSSAELVLGFERCAGPNAVTGSSHPTAWSSKE